MALATEVSDQQVMALMIGRSPQILTSDLQRQQFYEELLRGIAAEVGAITGDPPPDAVHDLAVWAVALGAAAQLDTSLYPDQIQSPEDGGRASVLQARYAAVLAQLRGLVGESAAGVPAVHPAFDPADFYDVPVHSPGSVYPVLQPGRWW